MNLKDKRKHFEKEYSELFDFLYRYVCYRIPTRRDAEDVVSEVCTQAFSRIGEFDPERGNLRQWTVGIAKFKVLMYWRSNRAMLPLDEIPEIEDESNGINFLDEIDRQASVRRMLKDLSPEAKVLLAMKYEDGMTHEEIAQTLDKNPAAVRKFFSRLYKKLRLEFEEEGTTV